MPIPLKDSVEYVAIEERPGVSCAGPSLNIKNIDDSLNSLYQEQKHFSSAS